LACCFGGNRSCFAQDSKEEETLFVAKKAFEDGFYEVSLGLLERFLKNFPESPKAAEANLLIGECFFHQGRFLDALSKFEDLLKSPEAKSIKDACLYWIAEVHFKGNNFQKAAEYYKMIVDEIPKSSYLAAANYSLGWCLFQQQDFTAALEYFKIVEEKFPQEPQAKDAPFKIIECLYNLKNYSFLKEKTKPYLKVFAKDSARLSYLYFYLAEADFYLDNFNEAIDEYTKVLKNNSDNKMQALAKMGLSWSYLKLKQYKEAESAFFDIKQEDLDKKSLDVLLLGKAVLLAQTSRVNEAKQVYEELIRATSDPVVLLQSYLGLAEAQYSLADYAQAINAYKEALGKIQEGAIPQELLDKLYYGLAWAYLKQGEFKEAIIAFQRIAKTSDDKIVKVSAFCQIGDAYQDAGDYLKAQEAYDTILKDYPDSIYGDYVQYQLGLTLLKKSHYDGAVMSFLALRKNFPASKLLDEASYALGLAYFQKPDYNSSRDVFERFQEEFKDSSLRPQAMYLLGSSFYNLEKYSDAIGVFKNIIRFYNQDADLAQKAEYEIADCFYQMGEEKEAMNRFRALRSKYPDSSLTVEIIWWLGSYYYRHNDLALARRYFTALIQDFPKSNLVVDAYYALGSTYSEESKFAEAIENFSKAAELGKSELSGQAAVALADIYLKQEKFDTALVTYEGALKGYPNLANLIYPKMADLYYKIGNNPQALLFYRKSLDTVPIKQVPDIQLKIGEIQEASGDTSAAIEEYLKVGYLYSENNIQAVKALLRVANIYEAKENYEEALSIYKKVIASGAQEGKYAQERIDWIKANVK